MAFEPKINKRQRAIFGRDYRTRSEMGEEELRRREQAKTQKLLEVLVLQNAFDSGRYVKNDLLNLSRRTV